jgi:hypothetical protein
MQKYCFNTYIHTLHSMDPKLIEVTVGYGKSHITIKHIYSTAEALQK